jgi:protein-S-isoprenylcysteine O-methyltransferase Ste14
MERSVMEKTMNDNGSKNKVWSAVGQFLTTAFIFFGLALLAWGPGYLAEYFSNPVRTGFAVVVTAQSLFTAWVVYRTPPHIEHEHRFDLARWHAYMFETIFILAAFGDRRGILAWDENMPLRWLGMGLYLVGLALSVWSNITWVNHLQREGKRAKDNPVLIYDGPFQWVRYPSMLSLIFYCLGFTFMFRSWAGLALMLPLLLGIVNRINNMEKVFETRYKKDWAIRRHSSRRFLPYLY